MFSYDDEPEDRTIAAINTTPLVDVMLVLLIVFLITIPVVTSTVPVSLPKERSQPLEPRKEAITLAVDRTGTVYWNQERLADDTMLAERIKALAAQTPQPPLNIRGGRERRFRADRARSRHLPKNGTGPHLLRHRTCRQPSGREMTFGPLEQDDDAEPIIEINTTPLIDVMLVLLITLIITIPVQTHAVKLDLPTAPPPLDNLAKPDVVTIEIAADGVVRWNQETVADAKDLEGRLTGASQAALPAEFHIHSDPHASYRKMAEVLSAMQRLGIRKFGIVGIK